MRAQHWLPLVVMVLLSLVVLGVTAEPPQTGRVWFGFWRTRWVVLAGALVLVGLVTKLSLSNRLWLFRSIAVLGSFALVLGFVEIGSRLGALGLGQLFRARPEEALGTVPLPNADLRGETYMDTALRWGLPQAPIPFHYVTNELGYRNTPERRRARVYTLGDSILVSALTPFERSLPALLEKQLGVPVLNLALIGIGPQREIDLLRASALPLDGRIVLHFLFEGNDLQDSRSYRAGQNDRQVETEERSFVRSLVIALQRLTQPVDATAPRRTCDIDGRAHTFFWTAETYDQDSAEHDAIMEAIRKVSSQVEAAGGRYAVVYVPTKLRILGPFCRWPDGTDIKELSNWISPWRARVTKDVEATGIPFLDLTEPLLASMREGKMPWFWGDTHLNEAGHEIMANQVSAWIRPWLERTEHLGTDRR